MRLLLTSVLLLASLTACAFFNEPVEGLGTLTGPAPTSAPASNVPSTLSPPPLTPDVPAASPPTASQQPAPAPAAVQSAKVAGSTAGTYFTVSTLFDIPENSNNISFVHFIPTGRSTKRELAMCKALLERLSLIHI